NQPLTVQRPERPGSRGSIRENRSKREKQLDMLARLFTKKDKCVAVCYHESKLFISSNGKEPKYAKEYIEKLREFANNQTSDNYEELLNLAIKQICHIEPENRDRVGNTELLDNFLVVAKDYNGKITLKQKKPSWERLPKVANELFQEVKDAREESTEESQKKIAKAIINKNIDDDIFKAVKTNNIEYIKGRHIFGPNSTKKTKLKIHAEMGMIERLLDEVDTQYIGLTKLSCDDCFAVIQLLNNGSLDNEDNPAEEKISETTSEVSKKETLSNPVELLEKLQLEELQARTE
ncbi:16082_t:CDS:2, partial [Gigaspora margarita]